MNKFVEFIKSKKFVNTLILLAIFYAFSFLVLMFCSQNSFLFARNDWVDVNWFITMGRGLLDGKLPYRDLFEQKGPVLFFVFALVALFKNAYLGTFFLETITLCAFLFFAYKFAKCFLKNNAFALMSALVFGVFSTTNIAFSKGGGAVEEYGLPIFMYLIFCLYEFLDGKQFSKTRSFLIGFWISWLFWIKYTMIIIPVAMVVTFIVMSIVRKDYKKMLFSLLFMMLGFLSLSALIILIFACAGGLKYLFLNYFYDNLFRYTSYAATGRWKRVMSYMVYSFYIFLLIILGYVIYIIKYKKKALPYTIFSAACVIITLLTAKFIYYNLPITIFSGFALIMLFRLFDNFSIKYYKLFCGVLSVIVFAVGVLIGYLMSNVKPEMSRPREDYVQYKLISKIRSYNLDNPTLLCYCYDYGFYYELGVTPLDRFYATNNFEEEDYPELFESYSKSINEQKTDFLIADRYYYEYDKEVIDANYTLICEEVSYVWENNSYSKINFYLFMRSSLADTI